MEKEYISNLEEFFQEKIGNSENCFVFTTDVVAQSWAEWCITDNHTEVRTVALERFLAWDNFKGAYVSASKENYSVIPAILRKIFVYNLIKENIEQPFLHKIIRPEYSSTAYSFSNWLTNILPGLYYWNKCINQNAGTYGELDEEDQDLKLIYEKYSAFLENNCLFEPSWIEEIEISEKNRHFYIIYPEQIQDFCDFETIFKTADNITSVLLPKQEKSPVLYFYSDARKELRQTILRMIQLVNEGKACWNEIALSVPDIDFYRPYLERELTLYEIPYVIKSGSSLLQNCAGRIFKEINLCHIEKFSFDSVRSLILDDYVPWKKSITFNMAKTGEKPEYVEFDLTQLREKLVREGNRLRCITGYEEKNPYSESGETEIYVDSWEKALLKTYRTNKDIHRLYSLFKKDVMNFFNCEKFSQIQNAWFTFKADFIDDKDFSTDSNLILSRCITHLEEIIRIEKDYENCNLTVSSPYDFFINLLESKKYTAQTDKKGLTVYPYKLSASASIKFQFVIDCSQKNLDVPYKRLGFLSNEKRKKLNLLEEDLIYDATRTIIYLYARTTKTCGEDFVHFSASEKSFSGFAIPHSCLDSTTDCPDLDTKDFNLKAGYWITKGASFEEKLTLNQKRQIENWIKCINEENQEYAVCDKLKKLIDYSLIEQRNKAIKEQIDYDAKKINQTYENKAYSEILKKKSELLKLCLSDENKTKIKISPQSELDIFYNCPRKWIFSKVLGLKDDTLDLDLIKSTEIGKLNHYILECFMKKYLGKKLPYSDGVDFYQEADIEADIKTETINAEPVKCTKQVREILDGSEDDEGIISEILHKQKIDFLQSPVIQKILISNKDKLFNLIFNFLKLFLAPFACDDDSGEIKNINGAGGCYVFYLEDLFARPEKNENMESSFVYYGKMDLVLRTPEKQYLLIDYKNSDASFVKGAALYPDENGLLEHFQMEVYCQLLCEDLKKELAGAYYYGITNGDSSVVVDKYEKNSVVKSSGAVTKGYNIENFIPSIQATENYCEDFVRRVVLCDFIPVKDKSKTAKINVSDYNTCIKCGFKTICRHTFTVGKRELKTAVSDEEVMNE